MDTGRSNPPPPECADEGHYMADDMARRRLGRDYWLWHNCGIVARQTGIPFAFVWDAATQLRDAGHAPRDSRVIALADDLRADFNRDLEAMDQRRHRRQERREREAQAAKDGRE